MQLSMQASRNGVLASAQAQDLIASNLANLNTTAFKRSKAEQSNFPIPGTRVSSTPMNFNQGDLVATERELDVGISGDGFFTVLKGGQPAYTRAGNFHADRDGTLVTPQGYPVEPQITIPPESERVVIQANGRVLSITNGGQTATEIGQIEAARFQNNLGLVPIGDNLFLEGPDSGPPQTGDFGEEGFPTVRQQSLEQSNVDLAEELTQELITQRSFQANLRAFSTSDELIGNTLDLFR